MLTFFARRLRDHDRGFTLIELLIVIAIIAILAAVLIPNFLRSRAQAAVAASKSNMKNIATALESYAIDHNGQYPASQAELYDQGYMKAVPTIPNTTAQYTYKVDNTAAPPIYGLCDDVTLKAVSPGKVLTYRPDKGLEEATLDSCADFTVP